MGHHTLNPRADAYTSLPRPRQANGQSKLVPAAASLAAAAMGLAWMMAPVRFASSESRSSGEPLAVEPVKPALAAPKESAAPRIQPAASSPLPRRAESELGAQMGSVVPAGVAAAALAFAAPAVAWKWPTQLKGEFMRGLTGGSGAPEAAAPLTILRQTILSWNPSGPDGQRALYHQVMSDGTERQRVESQLNIPPAPVLQDPLVFDLAGTGIKTSARKVIYGITGTRADDQLKWLNEVEEGMGILVFDADKNGTSGRTGLELFGDQTDLNGDGRSDGFPDGFSSLRAFVDRASRDGVLPKDARARGLLDAAALAALERAYGLKMKVGGFNRTPVSLATAGVRAIAFSEAPAEERREFDGRGNGLSLQRDAAFLRGDGSRGIYANVWLTAK